MSDIQRIATAGSANDLVLHQLGQEGSANLLAAFLRKYDNPNTRQSYENDLAHFFGWMQAPESPVEDAQRIYGADAGMVRQVTFLHAQQYISAMIDSYSLRTMHRKMSTLRRFFRFCCSLQVLATNPFDSELVQRPKSVSEANYAPEWLSLEEARALLRSASVSSKTGPRDYAMILLMLTAALRRSEVAGVDVEHIRSVGDYWILDIPSSKSGRQFRKLTTDTILAIDTLRAAYGITSGPLFRSLSNRSKQQRLTPDAVYRIVKRLARYASIGSDKAKRIGAHTLRHTSITAAIEGGASVQQAQHLAGHASVNTTMIYVHQRDRLKDNAADYIKI